MGCCFCLVSSLVSSNFEMPISQQPMGRFRRDFHCMKAWVVWLLYAKVNVWPWPTSVKVKFWTSISQQLMGRFWCSFHCLISWKISFYMLRSPYDLDLIFQGQILNVYISVWRLVHSCCWLMSSRQNLYATTPTFWLPWRQFFSEARGLTAPFEPPS